MGYVVRIPTAEDAAIIARALRRSAELADLPSEEAHRCAELATDLEAVAPGPARRPHIIPDTPNRPSE